MVRAMATRKAGRSAQPLLCISVLEQETGLGPPTFSSEVGRRGYESVLAERLAEHLPLRQRVGEPSRYVWSIASPQPDAELVNRLREIAGESGDA